MRRYHLSEDIGEARNLAGSEPERLERLRRKLEARYSEVLSSQHVWPHVPEP